MGAMVALDALTRPAAPPAAGLLVLAGTLRFCRAPDWPFGQPPAAVRALRRAVLRNAREALAAFYRQVREPASAETLPMPAEPMSDPRQLAAALDLLADLDLRDRPPPMCAVQWLHGDRDAVIPIEAGLESARCFGLTIEILPGAGHDLPGTHGMRVRDVLLCNMKCS